MKKRTLYPLVLPSWGSMLPSSPPSGYGHVRFERIEGEPAIPDGPQSDLDEKALDVIEDLFRRDKR